MIHRDIKPANILMNRHGEFKVRPVTAKAEMFPNNI